MDRGSLDRRITFEARVASTGNFLDAGGTQWAPVVTVWANVQDVLPSRTERMAEGLSIAARPTRIRTSYRTGLNAAMRIRHGDRVMQIIGGPAEIGWREGLELLAQDYSTDGAAS